MLIILFFAVYRWVFPRNSGEKRGLSDARGTAMSLISGAGISGVSYLWIMAAKDIPAFQESLSAMEAANQSIESGSAAQLLLTVAIAAPLLEELLFRGIVLRSLQKVLPVWVAIALSAILFGAYHMNPAQAVYATFMGIIAAMQSFIPQKAGNAMIDMACLAMIVPMGYVIYRLFRRR